MAAEEIAAVAEMAVKVAAADAATVMVEARMVVA